MKDVKSNADPGTYGISGKFCSTHPQRVYLLSLDRSVIWIYKIPSNSYLESSNVEERMSKNNDSTLEMTDRLVVLFLIHVTQIWVHRFQLPLEGILF